MAVHYILERNVVVTRAQVLAHFPKAFVSNTDALKGIVPTDVNSNATLGIDVDGDIAWISFCNGVVSCIDVYGDNGDNAIDQFVRTFDARAVCEDEDDFPYHSFPVDVNTETPHDERGQWQLFKSGDLVYLYDKQNNLFYDHIVENVNNYNFDKMIEEAVG